MSIDLIDIKNDLLYRNQYCHQLKSESRLIINFSEVINSGNFLVSN